MNLSFEFFPPKTPEGFTQLTETAKVLARFTPEFFSVTYGAGGSTQEFTLNTIALLQTQGLNAVPHISCIGATKAKISELLQHYQNHGVKSLVTLRGDLPSGVGSLQGDFPNAADLVAFIRKTTGDHFQIFVAAYPECHPQVTNLPLDLRYFKQKVDQGANAAITQYFFNPDAYCQFCEDAQKLGVNVPIIPGIMPIYNFSQLSRFSDMCGAEIPRYIRKRMEAFGDDALAIRAFGIEVVSRMCEELLQAGAPGLHFYTLNKHQIVSEILENMNA